MKGTIKFIDLFAGIGGIRCGLELAAHEAGYKTECVFTSEIKKHAIKVLKQNHPNELISTFIAINKTIKFYSWKSKQQLEKLY